MSPAASAASTGIAPIDAHKANGTSQFRRDFDFISNSCLVDQIDETTESGDGFLSAGAQAAYRRCPANEVTPAGKPRSRLSR